MDLFSHKSRKYIHEYFFKKKLLYIKTFCIFAPHSNLIPKLIFQIENQ